jgi:hypothetical protein
MNVIIYKQDSGIVAITRPTEEALALMTIEQIAAKDVPAGVLFEIVDDSAIPADRTFRNAWEHSNSAIDINMPKAQIIAHDKRRAARSVEFAPLDIKATIPSEAANAEAARQVVRDKYSAIQLNIDSAINVSELKLIVDALL